MSDQQPKYQSFTGGLNKDVASYMAKSESYVHAKNMTYASSLGDISSLVTESANYLCVQFPYQLIGAIPLDGGQWCVFTTNNQYSEIGIVDVDNCSYTTLINDEATILAGNPGLGFNTTNLITGAARRNYDCGGLIPRGY